MTILDFLLSIILGVLISLPIALLAKFSALKIGLNKTINLFFLFYLLAFILSLGYYDLASFSELSFISFLFLISLLFYFVLIKSEIKEVNWKIFTPLFVILFLMLGFLFYIRNWYGLYLLPFELFTSFVIALYFSNR